LQGPTARWGLFFSNANRDVRRWYKESKLAQSGETSGLGGMRDAFPLRDDHKIEPTKPPRRRQRPSWLRHLDKAFQGRNKGSRRRQTSAENRLPPFETSYESKSKRQSRP